MRNAPIPEKIDYVTNALYMINLNDLLPDPEQPRKYLDPAALQELTELIRQHGVLQPIMFRRGGGRNFKLPLRRGHFDTQDSFDIGPEEGAEYGSKHAMS
ncbi:MAG: ParB N-terminal domain-containing protein [Deltaproteobacteria bacterium]|nr:ParB N-terminal domain-containing protein [Deltaproteobacteria bacterium]